MLSKIFYVFISRQQKLWSLFVVKCLQKYYSRWSGSWPILDWLFKIQNRSSIDKHDTNWATGHSAPGDCQTCKNCTFWISTQHYCNMNCIILSMCSPNQNVRWSSSVKWKFKCWIVQGRHENWNLHISSQTKWIWYWRTQFLPSFVALL